MAKNAQIPEISFANPSEVIKGLTDKFSLSLLILASAILFFQMSNNKAALLPVNVSIAMYVFLMALSCSICIFATYEFNSIISKYVHICDEPNSCFYTSAMLNQVKLFYTVFSFLFVVANISIAFLLFKYRK